MWNGGGLPCVSDFSVSSQCVMIDTAGPHASDGAGGGVWRLHVARKGVTRGRRKTAVEHLGSG